MPEREARTRRLLHQEPTAVAGARAARRLTQAALGEAIGLSRATVAAYEAGRIDAAPDVLVRLAAALKCPVELLERRRPLSCDCGYGYDPQPNGLIPIHTPRDRSDWCPSSGEPSRQPQRSAA